MRDLRGMRGVQGVQGVRGVQGLRLLLRRGVLWGDSDDSVLVVVVVVPGSVVVVSVVPDSVVVVSVVPAVAATWGTSSCGVLSGAPTASGWCTDCGETERLRGGNLEAPRNYKMNYI